MAETLRGAAEMNGAGSPRLETQDVNARPILLLAERSHGALDRVSFELIAKSRELAAERPRPIWCALFAAAGDAQSDAQALLGRGADRVCLFEDEAFGTPDEWLVAQNLSALIREARPAICLIGATEFGRAAAPIVAATLGAGLTADCTGLRLDADGGFVQTRPAFSGNIMADILTRSEFVLSTIRPGEFPEAGQADRPQGDVVRHALSQGAARAHGIQTLPVGGTAQTGLADAPAVVAVGGGIRSPEGIAMAHELASLLGGEIGASRKAVESGLMGRERQIGYSGMRVRPKLYVACGISGAMQHLAGMGGAERVIAINSDADAPIFGSCDLGIIGDAHEILPRIIAAVKERRDIGTKCRASSRP